VAEQGVCRGEVQVTRSEISGSVQVMGQKQTQFCVYHVF